MAPSLAGASAGAINACYYVSGQVMSHQGQMHGNMLTSSPALCHDLLHAMATPHHMAVCQGGQTVLLCPVAVLVQGPALWPKAS